MEASAAETNKAVIEAIYDAFNSKDIGRLSSLAEPNATVTNVAFGNLEQSLRDHFQNWATAFPDGKIEITRFIAGNDAVMCEYTGRGTHAGVLKTQAGSIPPTNRRVEGSMVEIFKFRNVKVASSRVYFDPINLLHGSASRWRSSRRGSQRGRRRSCGTDHSTPIRAELRGSARDAPQQLPLRHWLERELCPGQALRLGTWAAQRGTYPEGKGSGRA